MTSLRHALTRAWLNRGVLACILWPVSAIYGALVGLRKTLYRLGFFHTHHLPVPVIVVGNVLVGGVGKTPVTMALVQHLSHRGLRVGVVSRGYGRDTRDVRPALPNSRAQDVGDEPLLMAQTCNVPVWVGSDRAAAGLALLEQHPDVNVIVCDDGLQHLALAHDLALCVFDERAQGNGWLLPAGPLREPWPRPTTCPTWVVKTAGQAGANEFVALRHLANYARRADGTTRELQSWNKQAVQALAGIAKPEAFFDMLRAQGITLTHTHALADHADLSHLQLELGKGDVLCTEKDAVKLWATHPQAWAVPLITELPTDLLAAVDQALDAKLSSLHGLQTH